MRRDERREGRARPHASSALRVLLVTACAALAGDAVAGPPPDPERDSSSGDLLRRFGPWDACDGWLEANRWAILGVSRRATSLPASGKRVEDPAARGRAHEAIVVAMASKDVFVASEAALALGLAGDAKDITRLADVVTSGTATSATPRRMLRWAALGLGELPLGDVGEAAAAGKALLVRLSDAAGREDDNAHFWANCAYAPGLLASTAEEKKLLHEVVAQSVDETCRREAATALALLHDHEVVDQLKKILAGKEPDRDRGAAAECLDLVGDDADIDALVAVVTDKKTSDSLRACALHGLGRLIDREEGARLAKVVADGRLGDTRGLIDPFADLHGRIE